MESYQVGIILENLYGGKWTLKQTNNTVLALSNSIIIFTAFLLQFFSFPD